MKEYIEASEPTFSIGEYWDSLAYEGGTVSYNQGTLYRNSILFTSAPQLTSCFT